MTPVDADDGTVRLEVEDVGFADVELVRLTQWPWLEIRITARDVDIQRTGVDQLLIFLEKVLNSDNASDGFGLTYDFRLLKKPAIALLLAIATWSAAPGRRELFVKRCIFCQVCVPSGWKFAAAKAIMSAFFQIAAPTCKTYLTTDFDAIGDTGVCFEPPSSCKDNAAVDSTAEAALGNHSQHVQRGSCFGGLFSCFRLYKARCRGDSDLPREPMAQIAKLQQENHELNCRIEELIQRLEKVEMAVPWAKALHRGT